MPRNATVGDDGIRYYKWLGRKCISNTSLRKVIGMAFGLHNWVVNKTIDATIEEVVPMVVYDEASDSNILDLPATDDKGNPITAEQALKGLRTRIRARSMGERDSAADKGTAVHDAVDRKMSADEVAPELAPYVRNIWDAHRTLNIKPLLTESQAWNLTEGYAGSFDLLGTVFTGTEDEVLAIVDYKTGKGLYIDNLLQLLGYGMCEFIGADGTVDHAATDLLKKVQSLMLLHVSDTGWELIELQPDPDTWRAFTSMAFLANWFASNPNLDKYITKRMYGAA